MKINCVVVWILWKFIVILFVGGVKVKFKIFVIMSVNVLFFVCILFVDMSFMEVKMARAFVVGCNCCRMLFIYGNVLRKMLWLIIL